MLFKLGAFGALWYTSLLGGLYIWASIGAREEDRQERLAAAGPGGW